LTCANGNPQSSENRQAGSRSDIGEENERGIDCRRQAPRQAYCAEGRGGPRDGRPSDTAWRACRGSASHNGAVRLCWCLHDAGAQGTWRRHNVYRVDPTSGAWTKDQLLEVDNPSFLTVDRAQRFLYSVHADLDEVSAYAIDKQTGHITALNRQSCGGKNPVHLSIDPTGAGSSPPITAPGRSVSCRSRKTAPWDRAAIW
jgi:hypothetical protein